MISNKEQTRWKIRMIDWILIGALLAGAGLALFAVHHLQRDTGMYAEIRINGKESVIYPLSQERNFTITCEQGTNRAVIRDGTISVTDADCPDHYCVRQGSISRVGETIVCLPHRLVIEIKDSTVDRPADDINTDKEDDTPYDTLAK